MYLTHVKNGKEPPCHQFYPVIHTCDSLILNTNGSPFSYGGTSISWWRAKGPAKYVRINRVSLYRSSFPYIFLQLGQRILFVSKIQLGSIINAAFWLVELLLGYMLYPTSSEKRWLWKPKQWRLNRVLLAKVVLSQYFWPTSWILRKQLLFLSPSWPLSQ